MENTRQSISLLVHLPVQFSAMRNGNDLTIYNVSVDGLASLFDNLPQSTRVEVMELCARHARWIK
jgi:hypothetical protein